MVAIRWRFWLALVCVVGSVTAGLVAFAPFVAVCRVRLAPQPVIAPAGTQTLAGVEHARLFLSPDDRSLAWFGFVPNDMATVVGLVSTADGNSGPTRKLRGQLVKLAWSPDSSLLAVLAYDEPLLLLNGTDLSIASTLGKIRPGGVAGGVLSFSPDGNSLAAGDGGCGIVEWNLRRRSARRMMELPIPPIHLAYSPNGSWIAASTHRKIVVWDVAANAPVWSFEELHQEPESRCYGINGLFWSGSRLVTMGVDGMVRLWDVGAKKQLRAYPMGAGDCCMGSATASGKRLLIAGSWNLSPPQTGCCFLINPDTGHILEYYGPYNGELSSVAISPRGNFVYCASGRVEVEDPFRGAVYRFPVKPAAMEK